MDISIGKMPSIVRRLNLTHQLSLGSDITPVEGGVIIVEALDDQGTHNTFEYSNGRLGRLVAGDVIPAVFGKRRALREYSGHIPDQVAVGDILYLLCESGVVGALDGKDASWGTPLKVRVLGAAIDDNGKPLNIKHDAVPLQTSLPDSAPIVAVLGTSMDCGKTTAAVEIIKFLASKGLRVAAAKLAGVAFMQDPLKLLDAGAYRVMDFLDAGLPSTCNHADDALGAALGVLGEINQSNPDVIVLEFGDGILGEYNVGHMLKSQEIAQHIVATVVAAGDLVGAWGVQQLLAQYNLAPTVVTGRAVNNDTAVAYIENHFNVPAESNQNGMHKTKGLLWPLLPAPANPSDATAMAVANNGHIG